MRAESWQRNLAAIWIAQLMPMVAFSFVFPFFPLYVQSLGVEDATQAAQWAGVIVASSAISMSVAQPIWGNLADRFGRKPMLIRSMLGASVLVTLMGLVQSPEQLLVVRLIQGSVTGVSAAGNALVATSTPKEKLGFALGLMQVAAFIGSSIGPLIGGLIADSLGFRAAFLAAGALMLLGGLVVIGFVHEDFTRPSANTPQASIWSESHTLLAVPRFPILVGVIFLISFGGVIISPVLSLFIAQLSGAENAATTAGIVLAATGAVSAASAVMIGRISDRVGHATILPICLAGSALAYFPQAAVQQVWQLLLLRLAMGVFLGGLMPSANALIASLVPRERRGAAFGLTGTASSLAHAAGPLCAVVIVGQWGFRDVFLVTGVFFSLAFAWVVVGFRRRPLPRQEVRRA